MVDYNLVMRSVDGTYAITHENEVVIESDTLEDLAREVLLADGGSIKGSINYQKMRPAEPSPAGFVPLALSERKVWQIEYWDRLN